MGVKASCHLRNFPYHIKFRHPFKPSRTLDLKISSVSFALATTISAAFAALSNFHRVGLLLMLMQV